MALWKTLIVALAIVLTTQVQAEQQSDFFEKVSAFQQAGQLNSVIELSADEIERIRQSNQLDTPYGLRVMHTHVMARVRSLTDINQQLLDLANEYYAISQRVGEEHREWLSRGYEIRGEVQYELGNNPAALQLFDTALTLRAEHLGADNPDLIPLYSRVAILAQTQNDFPRAEGYMLQARNIALQQLGTEHPRTIGVTANLAFLYNYAGRYQDALRYYHQSLAMSRTYLGPHHINSLIIQNNIGDTYYGIGAFEQAAIHMRETANNMQEALGEHNGHFAKAIHNLGNIHRDQGLLDEAERYYQQVEGIYPYVYEDENHYERGRLQRDRGALAVMQGRYEDAINLLEPLIDLYLEAFGTPYADEVLITKMELARAYIPTERREQGMALAREVAAAHGRLQQDDHTLALQARLLAVLAEPDDNASFIVAELREIAVLLERALAFNSLEYNDSYLYMRALLRPLLDRAIAQLYQLSESADDPASLIATGLQLSQLSKTNSIHWTARAQRLGSNDQELRSAQRLLTDYRALTTQHSQLYAQQTENKDAQLQELQQQISDVLERLTEITRPLGLHADSTLTATGSLQDEFSASLSEGDWVVYFHFGPQSSYRWQWTEQGLSWYQLPTTAAQLTEDIEQLKAPMRSTFNRLAELQPYDLALAQSVTASLFNDADLNDMKRLYVIADESTVEIPFAALVRPDQQFPTIDHFSQFNRYHQVPWLTNASQVYYLADLSVAADVPQRHHAQRLLGIGNPHFALPNALGSNNSESSLGAQDEHEQLAEAITLRSGLVSSDQRLSLSPLPETEDEIRRLATLLNAEHHQFLFAQEAEKSNVVASLQQADFDTLIISTHALLPDPQSNLQESALVLTPLDLNHAEHNGLLLASDIARLDINAELVILAGCNTGVQNATVSLSMNSLLNAFIFAGAQHLVASYWPLPSLESTQALENLLQQKPLHEGIDHPHPVFWAGVFSMKAN